MVRYKNDHYTLQVGGLHALTYTVRGSGTEIPVGWPTFEVDGETLTARPETLTETDRRMLNAEIEQITLEGTVGDALTLKTELRVCAKTPFLRWRYFLSAKTGRRLTKRNGEALCYLSYPTAYDAPRTEVRFSEYDALTHAYRLREEPGFLHENDLMGPILTEQRGDCRMLTAYEHGSMYPDAYICFTREAQGIAVRAVKGNYWDGQDLHAEPFEGVWLQLGAVQGGDDALSRAYRAFQLSYCSPHAASRKPYIFYNTWAFQERNKFYNKQEYLSSMQQARIEREIEIAHRMGVDVFVLDTGWYRKTGDWQTNGDRFPDGMRHIRDLLAARGMQLGLWFAPPAAACTSEILKRYPDCVRREGDALPPPHPVWETEDSRDMCLVSDYWEGFADRLIGLAKEVGVRYFKWDAVEMFGCDAPGHLHGDESADAKDRAENYSFRLGMYLTKVVDRLCAAVPDAIVDLDITEGRRSVGLGFLSAGKYFAVNNGPYYPNYDIQVPADQWINIFVNPGPARTWVCRKLLCYDKWIPSVLLMTHYLPDDPGSSQLINLASLVLGQNGIWGDLPRVSEEGVELFGRVLGVYKQVRDDVTRAYPVVYGQPGDLLEVREKIDGDTGKGVVCAFVNGAGTYRCRLTSRPCGEPVVFGGAILLRETDGLWIELTAEEPTAAILFFGAAE